MIRYGGTSYMARGTTRLAELLKTLPLFLLHPVGSTHSSSQTEGQTG